MSPKTKKMLLIAGAAVAGYVVYTKVIKKPEKPDAKTVIGHGFEAAPGATLTTKRPWLSPKIKPLGGADDGLGDSEDLGTLGGGF
jgi:hypothetical protein